MIKYFLLSMLCVSNIFAATIPPIPKELVDQTVTMIIPWPPGGDTDATQRFVVEQVAKLTELKITVINKGGAGGIIGARELAKSRPDGLTIMGHSNETFAINPVLNADQAVDTSGIQPVAIMAFTPQFIYTGFNNQIKTHTDIISAAKNNPKFTVGCNILHQCMYIGQYLDHYGIRPYTVLYKSPADMAVAAFNGDIDIFGAGAVSGITFVRGGRIRAVAATWDHRLDIYPNAEALGTIIPGYRANNLQMVSVPAGTPRHIVEFYNQLFRLAVQTPDSIKRFQELGVVTADLTVEQATNILTQELATMRANQQFAPKQ